MKALDDGLITITVLDEVILRWLYLDPGIQSSKIALAKDPAERGHIHVQS